MEFPVNEMRPALFDALDGGVSRFVVSAPTGSGKSTAFPVMLGEKLGGQIFVLQPRRVAARMLARSIEKLFDMKGETGWHIRFDKHYDASTKIVFLTEGILARMLLSNSLPPNVSAIVFDEFHERNIFTDLSIALALRLQKTSRPDLKLFAASASVDTESLARYMDAEVLACSSRLHNIDIKYSELAGRNLPVWELAAREFARNAAATSGNFLIFMAGVYEINRTISKILETPQSRGFRVMPLYGDMTAEAQDAILAPSDRRKVIVATNIAETSLTIEGVDCVIDSGFAKVLRYDFARAVNTLLVERISLASATQRAGRAGRITDGVAIRLWRKAEERFFEPYSTSEISRVDLSQTLLWLKVRGLDFSSLDLFETPPEKSRSGAFETLRLLNALDSDGNATAEGAKIARFPTSPRLGKLFVGAAKLGCLPLAAMVAATADAGKIKLDIPDNRRELERDNLCAARSQPEEIVNLCFLAKSNSFERGFCEEYGINVANARKAFAYAADFMRLARASLESAPDAPDAEQSAALAKAVLAAYPDRVCRRLNAGTLACRCVGGAACEARKTSKRYCADLFVPMSMQQTNTASGITVIADDIVPITRECLAEVFPDDIVERKTVGFDENQKRACTTIETCYRDLPLDKKISYDISADDAAELMYSKIASGEIALKNFGDPERDFIARVNFIAKAMPELGIAPIDDDALELIFRQMCSGLASYSEVKNADVMAALREWLSRGQLGAMRHYLPETVEVNPKRRPVRVKYQPDSLRAVISASFKDLFAFNPKSVSICGGKIKPVFEVLAPNGRPVQTTEDLERFWQTSWQTVRKELKARYPKHFPPTATY